MSISPEQKQQIRQIANNRGLIEAIKEYRRLTNASLREAKDAVEAIIRDADVGQPAPVSAAPVDNSSQRQQIMELIGRGRKIDAIKLYRQWTNAGLKEAKDAVEAMERGEAVQIPVSVPAFSASAEGSLDEQIRALLAKRQKLEAVKAYPLAANSSLKEAKDYVEAVEAQVTPSTSGPASTPIPLSNDPFAEEDTRARRLLFISLFALAAIAICAFLAILLWNGL